MRGKKLVIAIDGSSDSDAAVEAGLEPASALGSPVLFVHAASPLAEDFYRELATNIGRKNYFKGPTASKQRPKTPFSPTQRNVHRSACRI